VARNGSLIPESKTKLNSLKTEVANSLNIELKQGYNGDLTSRDAGSIGGEMVKRMIAYAQSSMSGSSGMSSMSGMSSSKR